MSPPNTNPETGIAYGYVAANDLDSEVVDALMFGPKARDLSFEQFYDELYETVRDEASELGFDSGSPDWEDWIDREMERRSESYQCDEPHIEGICEGVHYATSWLGGALHFFIHFSPVITEHGNRASPCVPNACVLPPDPEHGDVKGYDVPADWYRSTP